MRLGARERLQEVEHDLVRAVRSPHLLGRDAHAALAGQIVGQVAAQVEEVTVRIAVEPGGGVRDGARDRRDDARARPVRVLVDVEQDGTSSQGCTARSRRARARAGAAREGRSVLRWLATTYQGVRLTAVRAFHEMVGVRVVAPSASRRTR